MAGATLMSGHCMTNIISGVGYLRSDSVMSLVLCTVDRGVKTKLGNRNRNRNQKTGKLETGVPVPVPVWKNQIPGTPVPVPSFWYPVFTGLPGTRLNIYFFIYFFNFF
jgi:hypothetical protein